MGSHPRPKVSQRPTSTREDRRKDPKMCNPQQQNPPQNAAWQGVYPDLSALNELFSTQQATAANAGQPSPWIGFLASIGLQPIPGGQNQQQQQQARPEQEQPSAPPAPEPERQEGQAYAGANSAAWGQPQHQPSPGASQQPRGHSCGYSCGAPHLSPPPPLAHRARRPPPLLRHLLPPPCLRPLPPPALPAQAACSRPAPGRSC